MKFQGQELLIIFSTLIILIVILMMILIYVAFIRKKSELVIKQQEKELKFEQELALTQIEMREQTLTYVGRELHDDLGQKLSVAKMMTNTLGVKLNEEEKIALKGISDIIGECITDIRNLSKNFIAEQVEHFGLIDSIERELFRINKLEFINVELDFNNHDIDINSKHGLILFRIIQECMNNSLKHSKAKEIKINLIDEISFVHISIKDNGVGFSDHAVYEGSGLKNMINRAKIINAEFQIQSTENLGTAVNIKYRK